MHRAYFDCGRREERQRRKRLRGRFAKAAAAGGRHEKRELPHHQPCCRAATRPLVAAVRNASGEKKNADAPFAAALCRHAAAMRGVGLCRHAAAGGRHKKRERREYQVCYLEARQRKRTGIRERKKTGIRASACPRHNQQLRNHAQKWHLCNRGGGYFPGVFHAGYHPFSACSQCQVEQLVMLSDK